MAKKTDNPGLTKVDKRREQVKRAMVRRVPAWKIAEEYGVSKRTIEMDIKAIREAEDLKMTRMNATDFLTDCKVRAAEVEREAWIIFHDENSGASEKLQALNTIRAIAKDDLTLMQTLGVVPPSNGPGINLYGGNVQIVQMSPQYVARWVMAALAPESEDVKERIIKRLKAPDLLATETLQYAREVSDISE